MKTFWKIFSIVLLGIAIFVIASCGEDKYYTIKFDPDNGEATTEVRYKAGDHIEKPADPSKEDVCFAGWYYGDKLYSFTNNTVKKNITLTAKYVVPFTYKIENNEVTLIHFIEFSTRTSIVTPKKIEGYPVTKIGDYCFTIYSTNDTEAKNYATSVTISEGVTEIGANAFFQNTTVTCVSLPKTVTKIGEQAFYGCTNLTTVNIPSGVTEIGDKTFATCTNLNNITLPSSLTSIGSQAFLSCHAITKMNIPNTCTYIGIQAFYDCDSLMNVTLPNGIVYLNEGLFSGCINLLSIEIPSSVTYIADSVFADCTGMTSINIPKTVEVIGDKVFDNDKNTLTINTNLESSNNKWGTDWNCGCLVIYNPSAIYGTK